MGFFEDFSEKGKNIRLQPRPATWRRLEQRLDARRRSSLRGLTRRSMGMAAALGLLVVTSLLLVLRVQKINGPTAAGGDWEVIRTDAEAAPPSPARVSTEAIPEGQTFKQLVSRSSAGASAVGLEWLAGEWRPTSGRTHTVEKWMALDNGDWAQEIRQAAERLEEQMRLRKSDDGLQLDIRLEAKGAFLRYRLERQDASQLVFTNDEAAFPQRVAFRRLGPDHLSVVMYNPAFLGLSSEQVTYLQGQHSLQPQVVRRDLERVSLMY